MNTANIIISWNPSISSHIIKENTFSEEYMTVKST